MRHRNYNIGITFREMFPFNDKTRTADQSLKYRAHFRTDFLYQKMTGVIECNKNARKRKCTHAFKSM